MKLTKFASWAIPVVIACTALYYQLLDRKPYPNEITLTQWCESRIVELEQAAQKFADANANGRQDLLEKVRGEQLENLRYLQAKPYRGSSEQYVIARAAISMAYLQLKVLPGEKEWEKVRRMANNSIRNNSGMFNLIQEPIFREKFRRVVERETDTVGADCVLEWLDNSLSEELVRFWKKSRPIETQITTSQILQAIGIYYHICSDGVGMKLVQCFKGKAERIVEKLESDLPQDSNNSRSTITDEVLEGQRTLKKYITEIEKHEKLRKKVQMLRAQLINNWMSDLYLCSYWSSEDLHPFTDRSYPSSLCTPNLL